MKIKAYWHKYRFTMYMCMKQMFDGGPFCVIAEYLVRFLQFVLLCMIWKTLADSGADLGEMKVGQLLAYTLLASALNQQLNIITPATSALWEGTIIGRYLRPMPVIGSLIAETVGRWWIPVFLFYSLPLFLVSPLLGIRLPGGVRRILLGILSLMLSAAIGFALDLLFAALAMVMKNGCWAATRIRESLFSLLSGAIIPFGLFPFGLGKVFACLPTGSVGNAPLVILSGLPGDYRQLIGLQIFWAVVLWAIAGRVFEKSRERMVSYGG